MHACDNPDLVTTFLQNGTTPLMVAAQEGHLSVVELLVSVGAQVNSQNNVSNRTVQRLSITIYGGHSNDIHGK